MADSMSSYSSESWANARSCRICATSRIRRTITHIRGSTPPWRLRARGVDPAQVVAITQWVATPMLHTMGRPLAEKQRPDTGYAAKFSGPYTFASALLGGSGLGLGPDDFSDALAMDARRHDLM